MGTEFLVLQALKEAVEESVYDEAAGWPDDGIAPGTKWEDVPITWACPECGAQKADFEMVEV